MIDLPPNRRLVLGSGSPRRRELLTSAGLSFEIVPADIDETPHRDETPVDYVRRLAGAKAAAVAEPDSVVIAADTTVDVDDRILAKPLGVSDARRMLRMLSGRSHRVHTAVTVTTLESTLACVVTTDVVFVDLDDRTIDGYIARDEALDKAGAYAIQGGAAAFVERIDGSVSNVVGLPLAETIALLRRAASS